MWTDFVTNLGLLSIASADATSFFFILAVSNVCYLICNFLYMNAGWIHRIDNAHIKRPYKAPTILLVIGTIIAFMNIMFVGAGAKVWNPVALWAGLTTAALIIPVFAYRHYVRQRASTGTCLRTSISASTTLRRERPACCLTLRWRQAWL